MRETLAELPAGRPVQWLVTNLPVLELNHAVRFDRQAQCFWSERLYNTSVGPMRALRMYYSRIL